MRIVFGLVLLLGLGLAGFAVYMAKDYVGAYQLALAKERAVNAKMIKTVEVYILNAPLRYGARLAKDNVRLVRWPEDAIPEGAFLTEETLFPNGGANLRTVLRAMEKDEAILEVKVTSPGQKAGITSRLSKGMRAFAIRVDATTGVSGFLRPGDRVDIYWTGGRNGNEITKLIESRVQLIAVDQSADGDRSEVSIARTVTVEATPQQVASLAQAQSAGRLSLSLVGAEDETVAEAVEVNQNLFLGALPVQDIVVELERERICTIRTRRGAEVVENPIPCTN